MNTADIRTPTDPDLAGSYAAMLRAARAAEDLAIRTNTCILVSIDGKDVRLTAQDLLKMREQEANHSSKQTPSQTVAAPKLFPRKIPAPVTQSVQH